MKTISKFFSLLFSSSKLNKEILKSKFKTFYYKGATAGINSIAFKSGIKDFEEEWSDYINSDKI